MNEERALLPVTQVDCMCGDPECRVWLEHGYAAPEYQHLSDCAVHNEPAMPNGPCDCRQRLTAEQDGWVRVPVEPTEAMIDRFVSRALCVSVHGDGGWSNYAREQWRAMIAARPANILDSTKGAGL